MVARQRVMSDAEMNRRIGWERAYVDPGTGSIKRRVLGRLLNNVVAVGPSAPPAPPAPPPPADLIAAQEHADEVRREHEKLVTAEIVALDRHAAIVAQYVEALESTSAASFALQEFKTEARQLRELRGMLEDDLDTGPILVDRDGRVIDDQARAYIRHRAAELREQFWASAARADAEGDRPRARRLRRDALRSRLLAEAEMNLRPTQPGYGLCAWT